MLKLGKPVPHVEDGYAPPRPYWAGQLVSEHFPAMLIPGTIQELVRRVGVQADEEGVTLDWATADILFDYDPNVLSDRLVVRVSPKDTPVTAPPERITSVMQTWDGRTIATYEREL